MGYRLGWCVGIGEMGDGGGGGQSDKGGGLKKSMVGLFTGPIDRV